MQFVLQRDSFYVRFRNKCIKIPNVYYPTSVNEIQEILASLDKIEPCMGGPDMNSYKGIRVLTAVEDASTGRWRHEKCQGYAPAKNALHCRDCFKLYRTFEDAKNRQLSDPLKPQRQTPRRRCKKVQKQNSRLKKKNQELTNQCKEMAEQFKIMKECSVENIVSQLRAKKVEELQVLGKKINRNLTLWK